MRIFEDDYADWKEKDGKRDMEKIDQKEECRTCRKQDLCDYEYDFGWCEEYEAMKQKGNIKKE